MGSSAPTPGGLLRDDPPTRRNLVLGTTIPFSIEKHLRASAHPQCRLFLQSIYSGLQCTTSLNKRILSLLPIPRASTLSWLCVGPMRRQQSSDAQRLTFLLSLLPSFCLVTLSFIFPDLRYFLLYLNTLPLLKWSIDLCSPHLQSS